MRIDQSLYVGPDSKHPLRCIPERVAGNQVLEGQLVDRSGVSYAIKDGIPDLTYPADLGTEQRSAREYYDDVASSYDDVAHLTFQIQGVDEATAREGFSRLLQVPRGGRVLEVACGTGRDSVFIAKALAESGELFLQDLSRPMLVQCRDKLSAITIPIEYSVGNACHLPFPDDSFDAIFSFGGLGVFGDIRRSLREMLRVAKIGARVVVGDESMPPWLYQSEFGRVLLNNNPLFKNPIPIECLPVEARDVVVRYVLNGVYYLIEFTAGEGEPRADFDLEIPGRRGGTLRTRYYGKIEGVTPETHALAHQAREKSGKSMHAWLEEVVGQAARRELGLPE